MPARNDRDRAVETSHDGRTQDPYTHGADEASDSPQTPEWASQTLGRALRDAWAMTGREGRPGGLRERLPSEAFDEIPPGALGPYVAGLELLGLVADRMQRWIDTADERSVQTRPMVPTRLTTTQVTIPAGETRQLIAATDERRRVHVMAANGDVCWVSGSERTATATDGWPLTDLLVPADVLEYTGELWCHNSGGMVETVYLMFEGR